MVVSRIVPLLAGSVQKSASRRLSVTDVNVFIGVSAADRDLWWRSLQCPYGAEAAVFRADLQRPPAFGGRNAHCGTACHDALAILVGV